MRPNGTTTVAGLVTQVVKCMYKYTAKQYLQPLLGIGVVRVGTLHDFRKLEHKKGISDPQEGKKILTHEIDDKLIKNSEDPEAKKLEEFGVFKVHKSAKNLRLLNIQASRKIDPPDCFIFCTSNKFSAETMAQFEGTDLCAEITNIHQFFKILTEAINDIIPVTFRGLYPVSYQDRVEHWNGLNWGRHPAIIKETEFIKQSEIRAIWQTKNQNPIEPLVLGDHRLARCCREAII